MLLFQSHSFYLISLSNNNDVLVDELDTNKINFVVILEPSSIVTAAPDFTFITNVNSSNPEEGESMEDNEVVIGIPIRVEVNMSVNGYVLNVS